MPTIGPEIHKALLQRAGRRCECHSPACRHHRAGTRCSNGLRGDEWVTVARTPGAGDKLWNLLAMCPRCAANAR